MNPTPQPPSACLSVVIPVYNEERTLDAVLDSVSKQPSVAEIIVIDDASTDRTADLLRDWVRREPRIRQLRQPMNQGKGAAVRLGLREARAPFVIIQDADLEYDPAEYGAMLAPLIAGKADVVFGSRFLGAGCHRVLYFWHYVGNRFLTLLSNMVTNLNLTDIECCYKAFRREVTAALPLRENRFGIEPELTARLARLKLRIYEVSISYHGRTYEEGKKIGWRDGVSAIRCIIKYGLLRL